MTKDKFISLIKHPEELTVELLPELKELAEQYPYFANIHLLLAKAMHDSNDIQSEDYIRKASVYSVDKRNLYYLLNPGVNALAQPVKTERDNRFSGNYFDMIEKVESQGGDTKQSLKSLAERLKAARQAMQENQPKEISLNKTQNDDISIPVEPSPKPIRIPTPDYFQISERLPINLISEENVKKLIKERKYAEAITILNELNLINPKKSIYFADQIRFLEKILVNIKK